MRLPNPNGTAPGWFVTRPDGRVIVALPGPPREMRPMWTDEVAAPPARARARAAVASRTYRLAGIGESQVAELLGEPLLRATNPIVATYARVEAVDVRISAVAADGRSADDLVETAAAEVLGHVGTYVWATGDTTWSQAIGARLKELGWTMAIVEIGTGGSLNALVGDAPWVRFDESIAPEAPAASAHGPAARRPTRDDESDDLERFAVAGARSSVAPRSAWRSAPAHGPATRPCPSRSRRPNGARRVRRSVFLTGPMGRSRAALTAAAAVARDRCARTDRPASGRGLSGGTRRRARRGP